MTDQQGEILRITQEECAEVVQAISKVFRFGINEVYEGRTNKQRLEAELGDLECMIALLKEFKVVDEFNVSKEMANKRNRLLTWSDIFKQEEKLQ